MILPFEDKKTGLKRENNLQLEVMGLKIRVVGGRGTAFYGEKAGSFNI